MMNPVAEHALRLSPAQFQAVARAVAEPRRFAMLQQIARAGMVQCGDLAERAEISPATISHHLRELQEAELIDIEREGRCMRLSLRRDVWTAYLAQLSDL